MSKYIDADKLALKWMLASPKQKETFRQIIDEEPTAEVVEVRHGEWIPPQFIGRSGFYNIKEFNCNLCGKDFWVADGQKNMHYCPNCGAKMDGERSENGT